MGHAGLGTGGSRLTKPNAGISTFGLPLEYGEVGLCDPLLGIVEGEGALWLRRPRLTLLELALGRASPDGSRLMSGMAGVGG